MNFRHALLRAVLAAAAVALVLAGPSFGVRQATSKDGSLRDFARSGAVQKPSAAQRAAVRALHAKATWNSYGTPSTLMRPRGFLSKSARGGTIAARAWLAKHKVIFRLASVSGLRVYADSRLATSGSHAITFQQALSGLKVVNVAVEKLSVRFVRARTAPVRALCRPFAASSTFSPGWNPVPLTTSGCCWTCSIRGRAADVLPVALPGA